MSTDPQSPQGFPKEARGSQSPDLTHTDLDSIPDIEPSPAGAEGRQSPGLEEAALTPQGEYTRNVDRMAALKAASDLMESMGYPDGARILRDLRASPAALVWTKEKPAIEGYYWNRASAGDPGTVILDVYECAGIMGAEGASFEWRSLKHIVGEWAGPIPEPAAPEAGAPGTQTRDGGAHG